MTRFTAWPNLLSLCLLCSLFALGSVGCATAAQLPLSDHCDGSVFFNSDPSSRELRGLWDIIKWKWSSQVAAWPEAVVNVEAPQVAVASGEGEAVVTAINHATLLVQLPGLNVLTDPVYAERASPVSFAGPRRVRPPGIRLADLPRIDAVVVSHNHYDHLDTAALRALWARDRPTVVVPLGTATGLPEEARVVALDWWQRQDLHRGAWIALVEAQHWSARGLFDHNRALWGGYVLHSGGVRVYFAGDTGYGGHFGRIRARYGPLDVALLPIGAYEPRWMMRTQHMNPAEATQAHVDLGVRQSVGMHFGTFQLTDEAIDAPPRDLAEALHAQLLDPNTFIALRPGETLTYRQAPAKPASAMPAGRQPSLHER